MRAIAALLIVSQLGCSFMVKHPAAAAAIVGGTVALGSCELEGGDQKACGVITGSVALGLGLIAGLAMWASHEEPPEPDLESPVIMRHRRPPPEPEPTPAPPEPPPTPVPPTEPAPAPPPETQPQP